MEEKVASVLSGLGFKQEDFHKLCSEFSGGWQVRQAQALQYVQRRLAESAKNSQGSRPWHKRMQAEPSRGLELQGTGAALSLLSLKCTSVLALHVGWSKEWPGLPGVDIGCRALSPHL